MARTPVSSVGPGTAVSSVATTAFILALPRRTAEARTWLQAQRITEYRRCIPCVCEEVQSCGESYRILADETLQPRIIVTRTIKIEPSPVVFPTSKLRGVRTRCA